MLAFVAVWRRLRSVIGSRSGLSDQDGVRNQPHHGAGRTQGRSKFATSLVSLTRRVTVAVLAAACNLGLAQNEAVNHAERMAEGLALFRNEVRAVLVDNCLACHGGGQTMGSLDLSSHGSLTASGKLGDGDGPVPLLAVIRHERDPFMPFGQDKLVDSQIGAVARWVELGAPYDSPLIDANRRGRRAQGEDEATFWSFRPLAPVEPPPVGNADWVRTPIDRFVLARLEAEGIGPNPVADRRTLIRRATLDLLGLPPSADRIDQFVNDPDPLAYERLVDELLESPHYGERWARHWMDIARFADSHGFEEDFDRPYAYHYRDFLIKAFNRDMPYDRFVSLQIAGDELEPENPLALMATGFLGAGAFPTQITEAEFEMARYDELDDMIGTLGTAMLGLTVGCARCHDHKHDPIRSRDYYRMAAVFGHTTRTIIEYDPDPDGYRTAKSAWIAKREELREQRREIEQAMLGDAFEDWLLRAAAEVDETPWQVLDVLETETESRASFDTFDDGSILFSGHNANFETYTFSTEFSATGVTSLRLEALTHPTLPAGGPGRARDGHFLLSTIEAKARPTDEPEAELAEVKFKAARATDQLGENTSSVTSAFATPGGKSGWTIRPESIGEDHAAVFEFAEPLGFKGGTRLTVRLRFAINSHFTLGRVRFAVSKDAQPPFAISEGIPQALAEGLQALREQGPEGLTDLQTEALIKQFANQDERWRRADQAVREHDLGIPASAVTRIQATAEGLDPARHSAADKGYPYFYEQTHVLRRGDPSQKGETARPGFLPVLMQDDSGESAWSVTPPLGWERSEFGRAALARWLTDTDRGAGSLLARVIANRLWHYHFGSGLVATPSNFGRMGARPSHPGLVDWMARDLASSGWRLKRLHRTIMTSNVYKASAASDPRKASADPSNRLRWRWTPRRLEAEAVRDSLLSVSGLLDPAMYGPGTLNEESGRRSVYFFVKRSELVPSMMLFDWPEHLVGIGRRPSTTIAPQALQFLNSPHTRRFAAGLAGRLGGLEPRAAIGKAYQIAFARPPEPEELDAGVAFVAKQRTLYEADRQQDAGRLALIDYCQSLMSLNEFLYIR